MKRNLLAAFAVLVVILLIAGVWMRRYLRSTAVLDQVTAKLETAYGGQVQVEKVEIGVKGTVLRDVKLFEEGSDRDQDTPWLKIDAVDTDVSLLNLINGDSTARQVSARGAAILLRLDDEGNLLTRFPNGQSPEANLFDAIPETTFEQSEIVLRRPGQPDFLVRDVKVKLVKEADKLMVTGSGASSDLGIVDVTGSVDRALQDLVIQFKTRGQKQVTKANLERLPFVPAKVWREIHVEEAEATAKLNLRYHTKQETFHYRLEVTPTNARIHVPTIALTAHAVQGAVVVEDHHVKISGAKGQAFGGTLKTDTELDFRESIGKFASIRIDVADMNVKELPEPWNIPAFARKTIPDGKLTGTASLEIDIGQRALTALDAATLTGTANISPGQWLAPVSWLLAYPANSWHIRSAGKGQVRDPGGKIGPIDFDWQVSPGERGRVSASAPPEIDSALPEPERQRRALLGPSQALRLRNLATSISEVEDALVLLIPDVPADGEPQPAPAGVQPDQVEFRLDLKDASLAELAKNQQWKLPIALDGKASLKIKVSFPADRFDDPKAYRAEGAIEVSNLSLADIKLEEVHAELLYADGVLHLKSIRANVTKKAPDATDTLQGSGQLQFDPPGELKLDLVLNQLALASLTDAKKTPLQGSVSGKLSVRTPADKLGTLAAVNAEGAISSPRIDVQGWTIKDVASTIKLADGVLRLPDAKAQVEGIPVSAAMALRLGDDNSFSADVNLAPIDLAALEKLADPKNKPAFPIRGTFASSVTLNGKLDPFEINVSGEARTQEVQVDAFKAQDLRVRWKTDGKKLELTNVEASLYGGKATGTALVPFDAKSPGTLELHVKKLETRQLAKDLQLPFRMEGNVDGILKGTFAMREKAEPAVKFNLDLQASALRVQNIPTEQLHGTVDYQNGMFDYKLEGKSLGGTFHLDGQIPGPGKAAPKKEPSPQGRLRIQGVQIRRLLSALDVGRADALRGTVHLDLKYRHASGETIPEGAGTLRIAGLRWKDTSIAESLSGDVLLSDQQLRLRNFGGSVGEGIVNAQLMYHLTRPERSWFNVTADNVQAAPLFAWTEAKVEGVLNARVRGSRSDGWHGTGAIELSSAKVSGVNVTQWRLPLTWSYSPGQNRGHIDIHETSAQIARGRATGKMSLAWDSAAARVEGNLRFAKVDVQDLLRQTIGPSQVGGGDMTGRIEFKGDNVRSINDLAASLAMSFHQAQALQVPVLKQIAPYFGVGANTTFQSGEMIAKLDRGILRIQSLTLRGNTLQVYLDGNVTLEGRLNLEVVGKTGTLGLPTDRLRVLGLRVPIAGPIPLTLVQEASSLLSNRLVYLHVGGTARSPVIQPRPIPILAQEAVRFFLNRSNLPIPDLR